MAKISDKPEWAEVGEKVLVQAGGFGQTEFIEAEVIRHTAARIYARLADGTELKFFRPKYARQWEEVGGRQGFNVARALLNPEDPKVSRYVRQARIKSLQISAHAVADKLPMDASPEQILAAADVLHELGLQLMGLMQGRRNGK